MTVRSDITIDYTYRHSLGPVQGAAMAMLKAGRIPAARCPACATVNVPARDWCERCGASITDASAVVEVGPGGAVTRAAYAPEADLTWMLVRFDGADTDLLHRARGRVRSGERVRPVFADEPVGAVTDIEAFEPGEAEPPTQQQGEPVASVDSRVLLPYSLSAGELLSRFISDLREGRGIHGVRCTSCRTVIVPPQPSCARCWTDTEGWEPLADRGVVTTFVLVNVPFHGQQMELPYVLARVLLDGADTSFLHILGEVRPDEVRMGMRVEAVWRTERSGFLNDDVEYFRPTGEPDVPVETFIDRL